MQTDDLTPALPRRRLLAWTAGALVAGLGASSQAVATHTVRPWPLSKPAPRLDLADLGGRRWRLGDWHGQVVVLNFWATWCEPCRAEMPSLFALQARRRVEGVHVCAVNYLESAAKVAVFLETLPARPTVLLDSDGEATSEWTPRVFPSTVLIGRDGVPAATVLGGLDWGGNEAAALLRPLVEVRSRG
ncbi:MAG: TlpA family protein disulfide reductase [Pseudomonadota bacterium]|nr:TlpA family protein disulfide reductase [Pseudomonadota bacterium]